MTELSDELLLAYVDGRLTPGQARAIEGVLDYDAVTAERAAALQVARERLERALDALLAGQFAALTGLAPSRMETASALNMGARRPQGGLRATAFLAVAMLALGGGLGYLAHAGLTPPPPPAASLAEVSAEAAPAASEPVAAAPPRAANEVPTEGLAHPLHTGALPREPSWQEDAQRAYSLLGRESFEVASDSQANPEFARFQLAKALGPAVVLPDLRAEGLVFQRLQLLRHGGRPLVQMVYLPGEGEPVAIYARPAPGDAATATSLHATGPVAMASWTQDEVSYLLAARLPEDRILALAKAVREADAIEAQAPPPSPPEPPEPPTVAAAPAQTDPLLPLPAPMRETATAAPPLPAPDCRRLSAQSPRPHPCGGP